jgi:hypothetical protein
MVIAMSQTSDVRAQIGRDCAIADRSVGTDVNCEIAVRGVTKMSGLCKKYPLFEGDTSPAFKLVHCALPLPFFVVEVDARERRDPFTGGNRLVATLAYKEDWPVPVLLLADYNRNAFENGCWLGRDFEAYISRSSTPPTLKVCARPIPPATPAKAPPSKAAPK